MSFAQVSMPDVCLPEDMIQGVTYAHDVSSNRPSQSLGIHNPFVPDMPAEAATTTQRLPTPFRKYYKYHMQRLQTTANHVLFYLVDKTNIAHLALVGTDVRLSGHFVYCTLPDFKDGPPVRCTNRGKVMDWLASLGGTEAADCDHVIVPQISPDQLGMLLNSDPMFTKPKLDRAYSEWREDGGRFPDGRHYKNFYLMDPPANVEKLVITAEDSHRKDRRYAYRAVDEIGGFSFENGQAVKEWLDFTVGKLEGLPRPLTKLRSPSNSLTGRGRNSKHQTGTKPNARRLSLLSGFTPTQSGTTQLGVSQGTGRLRKRSSTGASQPSTSSQMQPSGSTFSGRTDEQDDALYLLQDINSSQHTAASPHLLHFGSDSAAAMPTPFSASRHSLGLNWLWQASQQQPQQGELDHALASSGAQSSQHGAHAMPSLQSVHRNPGSRRHQQQGGGGGSHVQVCHERPSSEILSHPINLPQPHSASHAYNHRHQNVLGRDVHQAFCQGTPTDQWITCSPSLSAHSTIDLLSARLQQATAFLQQQHHGASLCQHGGIRDSHQQQQELRRQATDVAEEILTHLSSKGFGLWVLLSRNQVVDVVLQLSEHSVPTIAIAATQLLSHWTNMASAAFTHASTALTQQAVRPTSSTGTAPGLTLSFPTTSSMQYTGLTTAVTATCSEEYSRRMSTGTGPEMSQHLSLPRQHHTHSQYHNLDQARRAASVSGMPTAVPLAGVTQTASIAVGALPDACGDLVSRQSMSVISVQQQEQQPQQQQQHYEPSKLHHNVHTYEHVHVHAQQQPHQQHDYQYSHDHHKPRHDRWSLANVSDPVNMCLNAPTHAQHDQVMTDVCPAPAHCDQGNAAPHAHTTSHTVQQQPTAAAAAAAVHASNLLPTFGGSLDLLLALELGDDDLDWL